MLFAHEVLGVRTWHRQDDILRAIATHKRVAVRSGHKISKSFTAAVIALWWICMKPGGKVVMTAPSNNQIENILWAELRALHGRAKVSLGPPPALKPITGLRLPDGRAIYGFSTDKSERIAGISGENVLFIVDEGSGVPKFVFETIEGNCAGGGSIATFGNPTQTSGDFFDCFHTKTDFWHCIHVSSEEAAAVEPRIPGLATREFIETKKRDWGEDSPLFRVRVQGKFPKQASDAVVGLDAVIAAHERWADTEDDGPLSFGVDPARFGDDESVIAPRRGKRVLELEGHQGLDGVQLAGKVLEAVRRLRRPGEVPRVKVDEIGIGSSCVDQLRYMAADEIELCPVNVSRASFVTTEDGKLLYHLLRDELWFATAAFLSDGGAIPDDSKLQGELVAPKYKFDTSGRMQVEPKAETKKRLGRSPDRADAVNLAVYEPAWVSTDVDLDIFKGLPGRRY